MHGKYFKKIPKKFQKPVDKTVLMWYNIKRRREKDKNPNPEDVTEA